LKKFLLGGVAAASLLAGPVAGHAADLPVRMPAQVPAYAPIYNWSGFYLGINGGGGWGRSSHTDTATLITTGDFDLSGGLVGGTAGFNWQTGSWVWGLEGDLDWANIRGTATFVPGPVTFSTELRSFGTVRGRIGYAWDRFMPYFTGGAAFGNVRGTVTVPGAVATGSDTHAGWTVGGGIEYGLTQNISLKAEYLYVDLGSTSVLPGDSVNFRSHIVRGGLNWRFDWGGPVVARY